MGAFSIWHIVILGVIALVLFGGRGKVSDLMGDFGKGINSFKKGLSEKDDPKVINAETRETAANVYKDPAAR
ncbi:MAG: twin-arginine translocase TatA/TatE family subunit [Rhizomicrobium sp.]